MAVQLLRPHIGKQLVYKETWKDLIHNWKTVLNKYLKAADKDDLPHWHIERSHTGFLAAAVWQMRGVALEEYAAKRHARKRGKKKKPRSGRCDLYFKVRNLDCVIEAKHTWDGTKEKVIDCLNEADEQLKELSRKTNERANVGMAICWVVPILPPNQTSERKELAKIISQFTTNKSTKDRYLAAAYTVSRRKRNYLKHRDPEEDGRRYPGVIWVGRLLWPR